MALKLAIVSEQRAPLGARSSIVFGVGGGSIGRAHDNDWVLPDPERYLSAHHARVRFDDGAFQLYDTSTNGVYVNDHTEALGRRASHTLRDGDQLRLGTYQIAVSIDAEGHEAPEASAVFPVPAAAAPVAAAGHAGASDLGADLSMGDLLRPDSGTDSIGPVDSFGQPVPTDDPALLAFDPAVPASTLDKALKEIRKIALTEALWKLPEAAKSGKGEKKKSPPEG